jgi:hypothetical protein
VVETADHKYNEYCHCQQVLFDFQANDEWHKVRQVGRDRPKFGKINGEVGWYAQKDTCD